MLSMCCPEKSGECRPRPSSIFRMSTITWSWRLPVSSAISRLDMVRMEGVEMTVRLVQNWTHPRLDALKSEGISDMVFPRRCAEKSADPC